MMEHRVSLLAVDVPIGLPEVEERPVDPAARQFLGPRRSSVFPVPNRATLSCETWFEANEVSKATKGKGISQQSFGILSGIREVDSWIKPEMQDRVFEVHPEVSFAALKGEPMAHYKKKGEGVTERLATLGDYIPHLDALLQGKLPRTEKHDYLDALVALVTASRKETGNAGRLGGELDARGLRMEMVF